MFTNYTYQDWQRDHSPEMILRIINSYKSSQDFIKALEAERYFRGENDSIAAKNILKAEVYETTDDMGLTKRKLTKREVPGNRVGNNFLFRAVTQQNQYLLANGVKFSDESLKKRLGVGFDKTLEQIGERALIDGVCWGFWNEDHIQCIPAATDYDSGFVALYDEMSSLPRIGIQFWKLESKKPMYIKLFEQDGASLYSYMTGSGFKVIEPKRAYVQTTLSDAAGTEIVGSSNYTSLPVIPLYANREKRTELSTAIKAKIDCYDRIVSDYADNLDRANDVYWVLNNFGGTSEEVLATLQTINEIKAVIAQADGMGGASTAEPRTIQVPYQARESALHLLEKAMYKDYMALNVEELTGGSLTNVAIKVAYSNMDLKANRFEWQAFQFVQNVLRLIGVETEEIAFTKQNISNESEVIANIYQMRADIGLRKALELNPYILQEEVQDIMDEVEQQDMGLASADQLQKEVEKEEEDDNEE